MLTPAPNERRYTRYVAKHPLRRATPDQKGCNTYGSGAPPPTTSTTADNCSPFTHSRPVSRTPCKRHYTRSVALHPICRGTPDQKRCNAYRSCAAPPTTSTTTGNSSPQNPTVHLGRSDTASTCSPRLRTRGAAPVTSRCTRYVAMHPIRRGVMPTDRVHRLPQQAQPRAITPHRPQPSVSDAATHPQNARQCSSAAIKETSRDREAHARHNATHRSTHQLLGHSNTARTAGRFYQHTHTN